MWPAGREYSFDIDLVLVIPGSCEEILSIMYPYLYSGELVAVLCHSQRILDSLDGLLYELSQWLPLYDFGYNIIIIICRDIQSPYDHSLFDIFLPTLFLQFTYFVIWFLLNLFKWVLVWLHLIDRCGIPCPYESYGSILWWQHESDYVTIINILLNVQKNIQPLYTVMIFASSLI